MYSHRVRFPLMALAMLALLSALWAGLVRTGWRLPSRLPTLTGFHGPLMVFGFLGTLVGLERAVALRRPWAYAAPLLTGLGSLVLLTGGSVLPGPLLLLLGSLSLCLVLSSIIRLQPALHTVTVGLGSLIGLIGTGLWLAGGRLLPAREADHPSIPWLIDSGLDLAGWPVYSIVLWWIGFLVLTIAGERLELSRVLRLSRVSRIAFLGAVGLFLAGLVLSVIALPAGGRLAGVGMTALALWLLVYDLARRNVKQAGRVRFMAISLLSGYLWLGVSGVLWFTFGGVISGPRYDALLHTVFLGFVFAMIFAHAPIIFPAVLQRPLPFQSSFYAHLILLHLSLTLRVVGDLADRLTWRQWGTLFNVLAVLLFMGNTLRSIIQAREEVLSVGPKAK